MSRDSARCLREDLDGAGEPMSDCLERGIFSMGGDWWMEESDVPIGDGSRSARIQG